MAVEVAHVTCPVHGVSAQSKQERQLTREEMLRKLSEDWLEVGTTGNGLRPDSNIPAVRGVYEYCGDMLRQYLHYAAPAAQLPAQVAPALEEKMSVDAEDELMRKFHEAHPEIEALERAAAPEHSIAPTKEQRSELLELANKRIQELSVKLEQHTASLAKARADEIEQCAVEAGERSPEGVSSHTMLGDMWDERIRALRLTAPGRSVE
jgi:hypothetical protein